MMKQVFSWLPAIVVSVSVSLAAGVAQAHGNNEPEHGGILQLVGDISFELVSRPDGVELYVEDDGDEVNSADLSAKLTITQDGHKSEVALSPATGNKFEAKGLSLSKGARVAVLLTLADKQSKVGTNFTIK